MVTPLYGRTIKDFPYIRTIKGFPYIGWFLGFRENGHVVIAYHLHEPAIWHITYRAPGYVPPTYANTRLSLCLFLYLQQHRGTIEELRGIRP